MLDLAQLRAAIAAAPADGQALLPTERRWLEQVEAEIVAGRAAQRALDMMKAAQEIRA